MAEATAVHHAHGTATQVPYTPAPDFRQFREVRLAPAFWRHTKNVIQYNHLQAQGWLRFYLAIQKTAQLAFPGNSARYTPDHP